MEGNGTRCIAKSAVQESSGQRDTPSCPMVGVSNVIELDRAQARLAELNKKHAGVMLGGRFAILNEAVNPISKQLDLTYSSVNDFKNRYANEQIFVPRGAKVEGVPLATYWLSWGERRQYEGIVFNPGQKDMPGFYNLFRGFVIQPQQGDWSLFLTHILEVISSGQQDIATYILNWMAHLVQYPGGDRPGTSLVLRGPQGAGKGCFVSEFGSLVKPHFLQITNQNQLTGRFNNHLKEALLVFCDEGVWTGDKTAEGVLKGMITEDTILVEPKGVDAYTVQNHIRLVVASNNRWVIPAGLEERRFFVLDVSDKRVRDHAYFEALFRQMDNGGREAMFYDLLRRDLSKVNLRTFPRTGALLDQMIDSMNSAGKFWVECLRSGSIIRDSEEWPELIETQRLYQEYSIFTTNSGTKYIMPDGQLSKEIRRLCPGIHRHRSSMDGKRPWCLSLPSLNQSRKSFEDTVGIKIDWDEGPDV